MSILKKTIMRDQACKKWLQEDYERHWNQTYNYETADKVYKALTLTVVALLAGLLGFMGWVSW
jgi:hypothetical protein